MDNFIGFEFNKRTVGIACSLRLTLSQSPKYPLACSLHGREIVPKGRRIGNPRNVEFDAPNVRENVLEPHLRGVIAISFALTGKPTDVPGVCLRLPVNPLGLTGNPGLLV
jgi:hypothetical protein